MRRTGEIIKRYRGDEQLAQRYLGQARVLLGRMKAYLRGAAGSHLWRLGDGTTVLTEAAPFGDIVTITSPSGKQAEIEFGHGLFAVPAPSAGFGPGEQNFLPCRLNEDWAPLRKPKTNTSYVGGNVDWRGEAKDDRLTFHGPSGRYFPSNRAETGPNTENAGGFPLYVYRKKIGAQLSINGPADRPSLLGASIHRFVDAESTPRVHLLCSVVKTFNMAALPPYGVFGFKEIEFYWADMPSESGDVEWELIGSYNFVPDDNDTLATMTMFSAAGDRCCGVSAQSRVYEWVFDWSTLGYSVTPTIVQDRTLTAAVNTGGGVYAADVDADAFSGSCAYLAANGASPPYTHVIETYNWASSKAYEPNIICADYVDGELEWLVLERNLEGFQDYSWVGEPAALSNYGTNVLTTRLRWTHGGVIWSIETTSVDNFSASNVANINTGILDISFEGSVSYPAILWADVRSKSVLFLHGTLSYSYHLEGTDDVDVDEDHHLYLRLSTNEVETVLDHVQTTVTQNRQIGLTRYEGLPTVGLPTCEGGMPFDPPTDPGTFAVWRGLEQLTISPAYDPALVSCTPVQAQHGEEFFLSINNDYGDYWSQFLGFDLDRRDLEYTNFLYLDDAPRNAATALGTDIATPKFLAMGSF